MILVVKSMSSFVIKGILRLVAFNGWHALLEIKSFNTASLFIQDHLIVSKDVEVA
jgi:hypothetical protein